ncbi:MAG: T9SS type A sorting domain-containing protein [Crocinitomix sp.]|nr:T9SS type A sorting domain-containing protein [Crocinitomix sp.]
MKLSLLLVFTFIGFHSFSQKANDEWGIQLFSNLGFTQCINNDMYIMDEQIDYFVEKNNYQIFLSDDAFVFGVKEENVDSENQVSREYEEHQREVKLATWNYFKIEFQKVTTGKTIGAIDKKNHTYHYQDTDNESSTVILNCFDKLIYQNLYPNIDLVLELPNYGGLKYSFHVHPGGDYKDIQMKYFGVNVNFNNKRGLQLTSEFHDFSDAAPKSFVNSEELCTKFCIKENTVSFSLDEYDLTDELIIDPWLVSDLSAAFVDHHNGYEVGYDDEGNCAVLGNYGEKVALFDNTGTLLWTFALADLGEGPLLPGDLEVNPLNGDIYVSFGISGYLARINLAGELVNTFYFPADPCPREIWRLRFNKFENVLYAGLGGWSPCNTPLAIFSADLSEYEIYDHPLSDVPVEGNKDVTLMATSPDHDEIYIMTAANPYTSPDHNILYRVDYSDPSSVIWEKDSHHEFIEISSVAYGPWAERPNGFNGLVCTYDFLFSYDGNIVKKYNKETGVILDSLILYGAEFTYGGFDFDPCGSLFIGSNNDVLEYSQDLEFINSYPLPDRCFDLRVANGFVYISGEGFVSRIDLETEGVLLTKTNAICDSCNGSAKVDTSACKLPDFESVVWSPGGETDLMITDLCPGLYIATVTTLDGDGEEIIYVDTIEVELIETLIPVDLSTGLQSDTICSQSGAIELIMEPEGGELFGPGLSDSEFNPSDVGTGVYLIYYTYSDEFGCYGEDSLTFTVVDCLGINDEHKNIINVFPNPFDDFTTINFNVELKGQNQLIIYNSLGQEVYRKENISGSGLTMSKKELAAGVYLLSLFYQNERYNIKLIAQ